MIGRLRLRVCRVWWKGTSNLSRDGLPRNSFVLLCLIVQDSQNTFRDKSGIHLTLYRTQPANTKGRRSRGWMLRSKAVDFLKGSADLIVDPSYRDFCIWFEGRGSQSVISSRRRQDFSGVLVYHFRCLGLTWVRCGAPCGSQAGRRVSRIRPLAALRPNLNCVYRLRLPPTSQFEVLNSSFTCKPSLWSTLKPILRVHWTWKI